MRPNPRCTLPTQFHCPEGNPPLFSAPPEFKESGKNNLFISGDLRARAYRFAIRCVRNFAAHGLGNYRELPTLAVCGGSRPGNRSVAWAEDSKSAAQSVVAPATQLKLGDLIKGRCQRPTRLCLILCPPLIHWPSELATPEDLSKCFPLYLII